MTYTSNYYTNLVPFGVSEAFTQDLQGMHGISIGPIGCDNSPPHQVDKGCVQPIIDEIEEVDDVSAPGDFDRWDDI
jgi:hypothetical protein